MLSRTITSQAFKTVSTRSFSTGRVVFAEKSGFNDKERAEENVYVKKHEAEQLKALKEQLAKQKETIDKLSDEIKSFKK